MTWDKMSLNFPSLSNPVSAVPVDILAVRLGIREIDNKNNISALLCLLVGISERNAVAEKAPVAERELVTETGPLLKQNATQGFFSFFTLSLASTDFK